MKSAPTMMSGNYRFYVCLFLLCLAGCGRGAVQPSQVHVIGAPQVDYRPVRTELVTQNNCGGTADTATMIARSRTIARTFEWGSGVEVESGGEIKLFGTGVELRGTLATELGYTYGSEETLERTISVSAPPGANKLPSSRYGMWARPR